MRNNSTTRFPFTDTRSRKARRVCVRGAKIDKFVHKGTPALSSSRWINYFRQRKKLTYEGAFDSRAFSALSPAWLHCDCAPDSRVPRQVHLANDRASALEGEISAAAFIPFSGCFTAFPEFDVNALSRISLARVTSRSFGDFSAGPACSFILRFTVYRQTSALGN